MKLKRLTINRLPGIDQPFEIDSPGAGVNVIFGPNAIGKSSICRAVEGLYWDDHGSTESTSVTGQFELDGDTWWVEREGSRLRWRCAGEDRVPPSIPGSHHHRCFFLRLRDLIDPSLDGTHDIASEIRRQMSGGFDLHQIVENFFSGVRGRHGRRQRNEFNAAAKEVQAAEGHQSALQRREDTLESLQAQLKSAAAGAHRLPSVHRAVGLASRVEEYATVKEDIGALPDALASLTGQEFEQIERHQAHTDELNERIRGLESQRDTACDAARDSRLPAKVNQSELSVWRQNAEELGRIELDLQNARTLRTECHQEFVSALAAVGGGDMNEVALTVGQHGGLFEFLRAANDHRTQKSAIEWRLRLLANIEQNKNGESHLVDLRAAIDLLRQWLRAPEDETLQDRLRTRRVWILLVVAMAVVGAGMAVFVDLRFVLLLTIGAGIIVPVFLLRGTNSASNERAHSQEAFARLHVESPDEWDSGSVEARLRNLEAEVVSIESRVQRARDRDGDRQSLNSQLTELADAETSLAERRQSLLESLHLDTLPPDAELVDFARSLDQLRATRIKYEGASGRVDELETRHSRLLSALADVLQRHSEPLPEDATAAKVYLANLSDRNTQLVKALADERQVNAQLEQNSADRDAALESIKQIYAAASLDDRDLPGLIALLKLLPQYRNLRERSTRLEGQIGLDRDELAKAGEAELADCDRAWLDRLVHDLSTAADSVDVLRGEIADIKAEVNEVKRGSSLQDLIARQENARTDLQDRRDELIFAEAGRFLVDAVEREYEQQQMPRVFDRARSHFSAFTHHGYELRLGRDTKSPRLFAHDLRSNEGRELDELSDGTRAQLLLAARMAFAEEVERGKTLPLFLDEALDQSDPARFEAIARSLARIANDQGRQIFYLTSDPLDRDRIRHAIHAENCAVAAELDLGLIRRKAVSVTEPTTLQVPQRPDIPAPDGKSPEEYGITLGVPAFSPTQGYARQHFFYVLPDDLPLLREFLLNGIDRAGQWKTVSDTPLAERLTSRATTSRQINSLVNLLEVFCETWNEGRSRAIDREVLVQSGAVSGRYLDDVAAISGELADSPDKLLTVLIARKDPRLRGFRQNSVDVLEEYLRDNGYLDHRPVLRDKELTLRALASPPATELPVEVARECLRRWWAWAANIPADAN